METYTIFLLKENIANALDALDPEKATTAHQVDDDFPVPGTVFFRREDTPQRGWIAKLNEFLEPEIGNVGSVTVSAVMIVEFDGRRFALTFGHGKSLLRPTAWVRDFGLKATLNRVNPSKLRSFDTKVYEDLVVSTRKQTSKSSTISSFDLDIGRALLRGVTGDVDGNEALVRLTGSDMVRVVSEVGWERLDEVLEEVIAAYEDTVYQQAFGWFDRIRETDPANVTALDEQLLESLETLNPPTDAYLAPAEVVDWNHIDGFNYPYGGNTVVYKDLNIQHYLGLLRNRNIDLTLDLLKRHKIRMRPTNTEVFEDLWSVYDSIVWETEIANRRYVLFDGRWFEVDVDYAAIVTNYVNSIMGNRVEFPDALAHESEEDYLLRVVQEMPDALALLDQELFRPTGAGSSVEFCDLLSATGQLIHVKDKTRSATLSHLFSQGSVSLEVFLQDQGFRNDVRTALQELEHESFAELIPAGPPSASDFEVVYGVIVPQAQQGGNPRLPFFSAVNLMHHAGRIQTRGFGVSLQFIHEV